MKKRKSLDKYHKLEQSKPICPICGKHTIETETDEIKVKDGDDIFKVKSPFFRCLKDGECYQTEEHKAFENSQIRAHLLKSEINKRTKTNDEIKIPSLVKEKLINQ